LPPPPRPPPTARAWPPSVHSVDNHKGEGGRGHVSKLVRKVKPGPKIPRPHDETNYVDRVVYHRASINPIMMRAVVTSKWLTPGMVCGRDATLESTTTARSCTCFGAHDTQGQRGTHTDTAQTSTNRSTSTNTNTRGEGRSAPTFHTVGLPHADRQTGRRV
jgi:hypothetical protein